MTRPQLPQWTQISSIEPSYVNKGTAYLTASRYMWDDYHPYVFETTDYGEHWTTITLDMKCHAGSATRGRQSSRRAT